MSLHEKVVTGSRLHIIEYVRNGDYAYTELYIEDSGKKYRVVITIEHGRNTSILNLRCDCKEFKTHGICKHILEALSDVRVKLVKESACS